MAAIVPFIDGLVPCNMSSQSQGKLGQIRSRSCSDRKIKRIACHDVRRGVARRHYTGRAFYLAKVVIW